MKMLTYDEWCKKMKSTNMIAYNEYKVQYLINQGVIPGTYKWIPKY